MKRYFFDRVGKHRAEYDFCGREFPSQESARQLAELMAIDLGISEQGEWSGWVVDVRNSLGQKFFSIPVQLAA